MTLPRPGEGISFWSPADVDVLPDGSIVVLDDRARTVYLFDHQGGIVDSLGREGRGPGEFRAPFDVEVGPDGEIAVADAGNSRLSFWTRDGSLVKSMNVDPRLGWIAGLYWNRVGLFIKTFRFMEPRVAFYRVDPQAGSVTTLVAQYASERQPERPATDDRVACLYCETTIGADGEVIVASSDTAYRVNQIDSAGRVMRVWQRSGLQAAAWTDAERRQLDARMRGVDALARRLGRPPAGGGDRFTGFKSRFQNRSLGIDGNGRLWTRPTRTLGEAALFDVFGTDRQYLGTVHLDRPATMMFVRGHTLVTVGETPEGEPQVFVYRIGATRP